MDEVNVPPDQFGKGRLGPAFGVIAQELLVGQTVHSRNSSRRRRNRTGNKANPSFLEQLAYIARKLDATQEGPHTLLDNTMLLYCSSMLTGNHEAGRLPVVMLGGADGRIQGGWVLNYEGKPKRQMCRLYLSMMDKMNVRLPKFGDASKALEEV